MLRPCSASFSIKMYLHRYIYIYETSSLHTSLKPWNYNIWHNISLRWTKHYFSVNSAASIMDWNVLLLVVPCGAYNDVCHKRRSFSTNVSRFLTIWVAHQYNVMSRIAFSFIKWQREVSKSHVKLEFRMLIGVYRHIASVPFFYCITYVTDAIRIMRYVHSQQLNHRILSAGIDSIATHDHHCYFRWDCLDSRGLPRTKAQLLCAMGKIVKRTPIRRISENNVDWRTVNEIQRYTSGTVYRLA